MRVPYFSLGFGGVSETRIARPSIKAGIRDAKLFHSAIDTDIGYTTLVAGMSQVIQFRHLGLSGIGSERRNSLLIAPTCIKLHQLAGKKIVRKTATAFRHRTNPR
jgi:hypothetical protein